MLGVGVNESFLTDSFYQSFADDTRPSTPLLLPLQGGKSLRRSISQLALESNFAGL
jgi:hypothetical protein